MNIQEDKDLPDIILVDLKPKDPLLVFVEVVATDGATNERRKNAILINGFDQKIENIDLPTEVAAFQQ